MILSDSCVTRNTKVVVDLSKAFFENDWTTDPILPPFLPVFHALVNHDSSGATHFACTHAT